MFVVLIGTLILSIQKGKEKNEKAGRTILTISQRETADILIS